MTRGPIRKRPRRESAITGPLRGLGQIPDSPFKETHKWADYVELRCCASADHEVTVGDLAAWLRVDNSEAPDLDPGDVSLAQELDVAQEEDEPQTDKGGEEPEAAQSAGEAAANSDNRQRIAEDVFKLLRYRVSLHGPSYPFRLAPAGDRIQLADAPSPRQELYLFLLLCAMGRYVTRHGQLTKDFERLCVPALEALVPTADVQVFGTASDHEGDYRGNFRSKLAVLAERLSEQPQPAVEDIGADEMGDRGLDVAAIVDMGDALGGKLVVFVQAACTDEWVSKQDSPSPEAWDSLVQLTSPAVVACCIPHCFRNELGRWHDRSKIHRRLLLDRRRLLYWLEERAEAHLASRAQHSGIVNEVLTLQYVA